MSTNDIVHELNRVDEAHDTCCTFYNSEEESMEEGGEEEWRGAYPRRGGRLIQSVLEFMFTS